MNSHVNRGKQFEDKIKTAFELVPDTQIVRLIDPQNGYAGVRNICDFIAYHYPVQYMIECKSCHGNTLSFNNITDNQWTGLLESARTPGIVAGYMIWFIDNDITVFITANDMRDLHDKEVKSVSCKKLDEIPHIEIKGKKLRTLFAYDLTDFIEETINGIQIK